MDIYPDTILAATRQKDFIDLKNFSRSELEAIINLALEMKSGRVINDKLKNKNIGLLFSVPSTRTRLSFQVATKQLGGHAEFLNWNDLQLANNESIIDTAKVMSRFLDALVIRNYNMDHYGKGRETLDLIAKSATIPVINALDDKDHPCQVMADILTLKERWGDDLTHKKLVMSWGYSTRFKSPGVPHSMLIAASLLGMKTTFAYPEGYELDADYMEFAARASSESGAHITFSNNLSDACEEADAVYIKNWKSLSLPKEEDARIRGEVREDWRLSEGHFSRANQEAIYMDCLPQIRGEGVTAEVMDGPRSVIYDEAENRLHVQKAILARLL